MGNLQGFNAANHEPSTGFDVLPAGTYRVAIVGSKTKPTRAGTGEYLELELQVLDGEYQNRKIWDRLNIRNPSEKAQAIGLGQLSALCRAVGVLTPQDSSELHNQPFQVSLKVKRDPEYGDKNEVAKYLPKSGQAAEQRQPVEAGDSSQRSPW